MLSQNISIKEPRVQTLVNQKGDTLIQFHLKDAKIILKDILDREILDSIITVYKERDSLSQTQISLYVKEVRLMQEKSNNKDIENSNLNKIIELKNTEITELNKNIKENKREIRKQKFYKVLALITSIVLPIFVLIIK